MELRINLHVLPEKIEWRTCSILLLVSQEIDWPYFRSPEAKTRVPPYWNRPSRYKTICTTFFQRLVFSIRKIWFYPIPSRRSFHAKIYMYIIVSRNWHLNFIRLSFIYLFWTSKLGTTTAVYSVTHIKFLF